MVTHATLTRVLAARLVRRVLGKSSTLDIAIGLEKELVKLSSEDRGLAVLLARETLRYGHKIKSASASFMSRAWADLDPEVGDLVMIGLAQIWVLETPPHAAVSETVAAAKLDAKTRLASGFINAVLRKADDNRSNFSSRDDVAILPDWIASTLEKHYGQSAPAAYAKNISHPKRLHVSIKSDIERAALLVDGFEANLAQNLSGPTGQNNPLDLPRFDDGGYWVQNVSAALCGQLLEATPEDHILDLCAAPGGKSLQFAAAGACVTAVDFSKTRIARLRENLERVDLGDTVEVVKADLLRWSPKQTFKKILLDAPCTALGTVRRHPESLWIKSQDDVAGNAKRQTEMLARAVQFLEPGGVLLYCVCSPLYAEGEAIIKAALKSLAVEIDAISPDELGVFAPCLTPEGYVHILGVDQIPEADAFFIARLRRL